MTEVTRAGRIGHGPTAQSSSADHGSRARDWNCDRSGIRQRGAELGLAARTRHDLEQTAQQAQALGAFTCIVPVNVSDPAQVEDMVRHTVERFATRDILVNNAGLAGPVGPLQNDMTAWIQSIQVNLIGTFCPAVLFCRLCTSRTVAKS